MEPGAGPRESGMLDSPPPQPPGSQKRAKMNSLVEGQLSKKGSSAPGAGAGLGSDASNPQVQIVAWLGQMEKDFQLGGALLPQLVPAFNQMLAALQQAIPQAMADQLSGNTGPGAGMAPPPGAQGGGGAPAPMPPQGPPGGGGPPPPAGAQ